MPLAITGFELAVKYFAFDDDGVQVERTKSYEIVATGADNATKRSNAQTEADALVTALTAVTGAGIGSIRLSEIQEDAALAVPTDNLYKEAVMTVALNSTGSKKGLLVIPAPSSANLLASDGKSVDVASAETQALLDRFKSAGGSRLSDGEAVRDTNPIIKSRVRSVASGKTY